jgi:hypothetical protein
MDHESVAAVEMEQLVLTSALNGLDSLSFDSARARRREFLLE